MPQIHRKKRPGNCSPHWPLWASRRGQHRQRRFNGSCAPARIEAAIDGSWMPWGGPEQITARYGISAIPLASHRKREQHARGLPPRSRSRRSARASTRLKDRVMGATARRSDRSWYRSARGEPAAAAMGDSLHHVRAVRIRETFRYKSRAGQRGRQQHQSAGDAMVVLITRLPAGLLPVYRDEFSRDAMTRRGVDTSKNPFIRIWYSASRRLPTTPVTRRPSASG